MKRLRREELRKKAAERSRSRRLDGERARAKIVPPGKTPSTMVNAMTNSSAPGRAWITMQTSAGTNSGWHGTV